MRFGLGLHGETVGDPTINGAPIQVYVDPDEGEKHRLTTEGGVDAYDLESALDPDEIARLELGPGRLSLLWKRPKRAALAETLRFDVSSVGLFLQADRLTFVLSEGPMPFGPRDLEGVSSVTDVILRFLLSTIRHYAGHLKAIRQVVSSLEAKISSSMENRYLLQMFTFTESLTYYLNAIEANGSVLVKLRTLAERLPLGPDQVAVLDDLILENTQCARQAQIYNTVLAGLMDARGTIVNNNMNVLLKKLTLINIIFLPLNLIASIGGMSEFSMMTQGMDWRVSYALFSIGMVVLGWLTYVLVVRATERQPVPGSRRSQGRP
jgi:magnesium transporter